MIDKLLEFAQMIFSEQGFSAFLLVILLGSIWFWLYKLGKALLKIFKEFLENIVKEIKEVVTELVTLVKREEDTKKIIQLEHWQILKILENGVVNKLNDIHNDVKQWLKK